VSALVLIVDDDPHIRDVVKFAVSKAGMDTVVARDGQEALAVFRRDSPDLVVLDISMPEMDGTDVCREIRKTSQTPIVFLSSRDDEIDRIIGLELGGDDYLTKPFSPRELVARIKAVLRRTRAPVSTASAGTLKTHGRLSIDVDRHEVFWDAKALTLTVTEFGLLRTLMGHPGKVFSRDELMDGAYREHTVVTDRTIDSHVRRLRRKFADLGGEPVLTVHGVGYKLGDCA
jgi:two-component system, OmpR family, response regulator